MTKQAALLEPEAKSVTEPKGTIALNMAECGNCFQVLVSVHVHDFRQCGCDNQAFVDGGHDYLRRGWVFMVPTELSIYKVNNKFTRQAPENI